MAHVFISYSKKNRSYARKLADHLLAQGFDVWIDDRIDFGGNWEHEIFKAIDECDAIIVIMTPPSHASLWVQRERQHAENQLKPAFPLLLDGKVFPFYEVIQYYDVRGGQLPTVEFYHQLGNAVRRSSAIGRNLASVSPYRPPPSSTALGRFRKAVRNRPDRIIFGALVLMAVLTVVFVCVVLVVLTVSPPGVGTATPTLGFGTLLPTPTFPPIGMTPTPTFSF